MAEMITDIIAQRSTAEFAADVRSGLTKSGQKELSSNYLYDELGSALFNAITLLPEYGLFRADQRILRQHADEIVRPLLSPRLTAHFSAESSENISRRGARVIVAELGSGNGKKTRWILEALTRHQQTTYYPIEISPAALAQCVNELSQLGRVNVVGIEQDYLEGLMRVTAQRAPNERLLVMFLGSTIGNFHRGDAEQFLADLRHKLIPGDALLLGVDLVKPLERIIPAYDDAAGVTAAFNLNLLTQINRELGADFDLKKFRHAARYNSAERRIEMHLVSLRDQTVTIPAANAIIPFSSGETIWTESSYKYRLSEIIQITERAGLRAHTQWVDAEWPFAETLLVAE
jgi:L-histidine Nalpha-methyltransferase